MGSNSVSWVSNPALGCTQNLRSWTYSNAACNTTVMKDGIFATLEIPQVEIFGKVNTEQLWNLLFNNLMRSKWSFWLGFGETSPRKDSKNFKIQNLVCIIYTGIIFLYLLVLTILVRFLQILILSRSGPVQKDPNPKHEVKSHLILEQGSNQYLPFQTRMRTI